MLLMRIVGGRFFDLAQNVFLNSGASQFDLNGHQMIIDGTKSGLFLRIAMSNIIHPSWLRLSVRVALILVGFQLAWPSGIASTHAIVSATPLPHLLQVFKGHTGAVNSVAVSGD